MCSKRLISKLLVFESEYKLDIFLKMKLYILFVKISDSSSGSNYMDVIYNPKIYDIISNMNAKLFL